MSKYILETKDFYPDDSDPKYQVIRSNYWNNNIKTVQFDVRVFEDDRSAAFKQAMKTFARANPDIMSITKGGNGANVNIGELHIGSQGTSTVAFNMADAKVWFRMNYNSIESITINTNTKLVIINDRVAFNYE